MADIPHIPALRAGRVYQSVETANVVAHATGTPLAVVSQVNAGIFKRDLPKYAAAQDVLRKIPIGKMLQMCAKAGELFMSAELPLGENSKQPAAAYAKNLSASSGLPLNMVRRNMAKIHQVFTQMPAILRGLTRGLDLRFLDEAGGEQLKGGVSFYPLAQALGVVLPSNSPGVNSLWMPAVALKVPVILKPGREEPSTSFRIIQAFIAAGIPAEGFGFYPTDHEGAAAILEGCGRALLFGDESTTARWAKNPAVQIHGPGRSKVIIGEDCIERWRDFIDVIVHSIADNGGRSCVNASAVIVPKYAREIAAALAEKLGPIVPRPPEDEAAALSAFANVKMADWIDESIEEGLKTPGAVDVAAPHRDGPRKVCNEHGTFLRPTLVHCDSFDHPLANREFLFPFASVVEVPQAEVVGRIGHSLVVTAITQNREFIDALLRSPLIDRLNIGAVPTTTVSWDQPHEGNMFEFLYRQRALLFDPLSTGAAATP
jgi:acyl-CoA reductase-like NAD-dependent aldehyde dehydrogenase